MDIVELLCRHAGPGKHALSLQEVRRADDHRRIDPFVAAALEQQRDVEHDDRRAA